LHVAELSYYSLSCYTEIVHGDLGVPYLSEKEAKRRQAESGLKKDLRV
jgi:hypothetical protein